MSEFSVTIDQLRSVRDQLSEMNARFDSQRKQLAETASALNGMWEGDAKDKFSQEFNRDQTQMQNFYNALCRYVQVLDQNIAKYLEAESRNLEIASARRY